MNRRKNHGHWAILAMILLALVVLVFLGPSMLNWGAERFLAGIKSSEDIPFDQRKWLSYESNRDPNVRKKMFHDLRAHHLKVGMSKAGIRELLGEPNWVEGRSYHYHLGDDALCIDTILLVVSFDRSWRVSGIDWVQT